METGVKPLSFVQRFATAFGGRQALLLKFAGFDSGELNADGCYVIDSVGRKWLDFGSFGVHLLGHRHPDIVVAVRAALNQMGLSTKILANKNAVICGEKLLKLSGGRLNGVIFGNSGTESVEAAIRMASISTGRSCFAVLEKSYHGKSLGAAALTDTEFRAPVADTSLTVVKLPRDNVDVALEMIQDKNPAALFVELVQGEGGIYPISADYVQALAEFCRLNGTLFIIDEIQTGLGRTGLVLENHRLDLDPDILLLGKILGGGLMPVSATLFDRNKIGEKASDPVLHSSTFAGGALAAAAASAVVDVVSSPDFLKHACELGEVAIKRLKALESLAGIRKVRGRGLMLGIEFVDPGLCGEVVIEAAKRKLLVTFCLNNTSVLRIFPPAIASFGELDTGIGLLEEAVSAAHIAWDEEAVSGEIL